MRNIKSYMEGYKHKTAVPTVTLLSCSPMAKIDDTNTEDTEVATEVATTDTANQMGSQFNVQTHVGHFREIFTEYYDIALSDWAKAAIADNTTINQKACRLLGIPHVGCNNHKFNLDIDEWARSDNALCTTLESMECKELAQECCASFKPRTTKSTGWPNISFIFRKPKPLGCEQKVCCRLFYILCIGFYFVNGVLYFHYLTIYSKMKQKNAACTKTGLLLFQEIQRG